MNLDFSALSQPPVEQPSPRTRGQAGTLGTRLPAWVSASPASVDRPGTAGDKGVTRAARPHLSPRGPQASLARRTSIDAVSPVSPAVPANSLADSGATAVGPDAKTSERGRVPDSALKSGYEDRRRRVLAMLDRDPAKRRAAVFDPDVDPNFVVCAVAIRNVATFEMRIPREKCDPFAVLAALEKNQ